MCFEILEEFFVRDDRLMNAVFEDRQVLFVFKESQAHGLIDKIRD